MKRFLSRPLRTQRSTEFDIHAHHPWLVVMQPLASECAESLYVIYISGPCGSRAAPACSARQAEGCHRTSGGLLITCAGFEVVDNLGAAIATLVGWRVLRGGMHLQ